jgi:hypothetical protein
VTVRPFEASEGPVPAGVMVMHPDPDDDVLRVSSGIPAIARLAIPRSITAAALRLKSLFLVI